MAVSGVRWQLHHNTLWGAASGVAADGGGLCRGGYGILGRGEKLGRVGWFTGLGL